VHLDGGNWFADPAYGTQGVGRYEGNYGEILLEHAVYWMGRSGTPGVTDKLTTPHELCFSPDRMKLHIVTPREGAGDITVIDVIDSPRLTRAQLFTDMLIDGEKVCPNTARADIAISMETSGHPAAGSNSVSTASIASHRKTNGPGTFVPLTTSNHLRLSQAQPADDCHGPVDLCPPGPHHRLRHNAKPASGALALDSRTHRPPPAGSTALQSRTEPVDPGVFGRRQFTRLDEHRASCSRGST